MTTQQCGCGLLFDTGTDGRLRHKIIVGHAPSAWVAPEVVPLGISPRCRARAHDMCGGGYLRQDGPAECGCKCGHVDGKPRAFVPLICENGGSRKTAPAGGGTPDEGLTTTKPLEA